MYYLSIIFMLTFIINFGCEVDHVPGDQESEKDPFFINTDDDFYADDENDYIETCDAQSGLCWSFPINVEVNRDDYDEYYSDSEEPCSLLDKHFRPAEYYEMHDVASRCLFSYYSILLNHKSDNREWICSDACEQPDVDITTAIYDTGIYVAYCSHEHPFPSGKISRYFIRCVKPID